MDESRTTGIYREGDYEYSLQGCLKLYMRRYAQITASESPKYKKPSTRRLGQNIEYSVDGVKLSALPVV